MKITLLFLSMILSTHAFAQSTGGDGKGNGGDGVVCRDANNNIIGTSQLLDYYENDHSPLPNKIDLGGPNASIRDKVLRALNRAERYSATFGARLKQNAEKLIIAAEGFEATGVNTTKDVYFSNDNLLDVPDSGHLSLKKGCAVEQLAIRLSGSDLIAYGYEYIIQSDIWKTLDSDSKAGLILHEVIYKDAATEFQHVNSILSRYFNRQISFAITDQMNFLEFAGVLRKIGHATAVFPTYKGRRFEVIIGRDLLQLLPTGFFAGVMSTNINGDHKEYNVAFDNNGNIDYEASRQINIKETNLPLRGAISYTKSIEKIRSSYEVSFFVDGKPCASSNEYNFSPYVHHNCAIYLDWEAHTYKIVVTAYSKINLYRINIAEEYYFEGLELDKGETKEFTGTIQGSINPFVE